MPCAPSCHHCVAYLKTVTNSNNPEVESFTRIQILMVMGVTAIALLFISKVWQGLGSISLLPIAFNLNSIFLGVAIAVAISAVSSLVYRLWPSYRNSADYYLELVIGPLLWPDLIWLGLLPGLSEELLFRGVMLTALGMNIVAVVISSILFGVLHLSGEQQWPYVVWATVVGGVLGYSTLLTGNLLVPIVAHILTNLVSSCLWKWQNSSN